MQKLNDFLYFEVINNKFSIFVFAIFFISVLSNIFSIPRLLIDEPLYSYTALTFLKTGSFYHEFFAFSGKEFCLYPFILACIYKVFGVSFEAGRLFSFICGMLSFIFLFFYCKDNKYSDKLTAFILLIFLCSNITFVVYKIIRPEALLSLGICGFIYLINKFFINSEKNKNSLTLYGLGFFLGIIFSSHLIGTLFSLLFIIIFYLFKKEEFSFNDQIKILMGISPFLLLLSYNFFDQIFNHNLLEYISESNKLNISFATLKDNFKTVLLSNYIMGIKRIYIFFFEIVVISYSIYKSKNKSFVNMINIVFCLFIIISFTSINLFLRPYFIVSVPIIIIDIGYILYNIKFNTIISFFLCLYLFNQLIGNIYITKMNENNLSFKSLKNSFMEIPENSLVGGDIICWFFRPSLDWILKEDINSTLINKTLTSDEDLYWFNLPYPAYYRSSLSRKKSIFLSEETDINKKLSFPEKNVKEFKLISSKKNYNYIDIELWKLKLK